ncbi:Diaminopimelate decarboxylase [Klenkia soli]|uniref:ornithine decarboxylase n=1 Tax=Klenkia soli TaxID=1052260 RepID=A0A1H0CT92_9ACTN|nr:hypothetical protein [Klenkia soli]SDN61106.1 Diaminopimelate decarboxylase [Klenkia soli]
MTSTTARLLRSSLFWLRRYLPAELAGTAALLLAGLLTLEHTGSVLGSAVAATVAESVGFYAVALARIAAEQRRAGSRGRVLAARTAGLGLAEFGPAEVLDSLLVRPAALWAGATVVPHAALGLLAGKVAADLVFYAVAASSYRLTDRAGWRTGGLGRVRVLPRLGFWVRRYLPSELASATALLGVGLLVLHHTGSLVATALAGNLASAVAFYSVSLARIAAEQRRAGVRRGLLRRSLGLGLVEYLPAEVVDSALVRPALLYWGAALLPHPALGLLAGKVAADVVFYLVASCGYRLTDRFGWRTPRPVVPVVPVVPVGPSFRQQRVAELAGRHGADGLQVLAQRYGTPLLLLDPAVAVGRYRELAEALPGVRLHYAVKALDHPAVLAALHDAGACFDVASPVEALAVAALGVAPDRLLYSNPVAGEAERVVLAELGIRTVVVDNEVELLKTTVLPADTRVLVRLAYSNAAAGVDLSSKFGADRTTAERLVAQAVELGRPVAGFSFHVGSQLDAVEPFRAAITATLELAARLEARHGRPFDVLDIGGGFPSAQRSPVLGIAELAAGIRPLLAPLAGRMTVLAEPGRVVAAEAMTAVGRVVGVADRPDGRWVHLDDGLYGSYSNVLTEQAAPLVLAAAELTGAEPAGPVTLAGPTCDSVDVVVRGYPMPPLAPGDLVVTPAMGAYTAVTATSFNGRSPARVVVVGSKVLVDRRTIVLPAPHPVAARHRASA